MRHGAGEVTAGRIGAVGDEPQSRSRELRERAGERADLGVRGMALRERSQKYRMTLTVAEGRGQAAMRIAHRRFAYARRDGLARRRRGRANHGRQSAEQVRLGTVAGDGEQVFELARIEERHLGAPAHRRLADAMRQKAASRGADSSR